MTIQIYDSMARSTVPLRPRDPGRISMYCCGPTVYNYIHIGNARTILWFDMIRRYLVYRGYEVTYVMNYTDVDDRIIERANLEKVPPEAITTKYTNAFEEDMAAMGATPADVVVRATDHIEQMVESIQGLIDKDIAYEAGGDVWFAVESFEGYGKLSNRSLDDMRAGERIEPHEGKRHPLDFALWKSAKEGEPSWPSPWGPGRPGWHIECSVMSTKYLGMGFDIHGGGTDLIFPHHENEIAQAEGLEGTEPFARHWLHTGMVQMESQKMSKSLGNVALAHDVVQAYPGQVARYWALTGSYRSQVVFSDDSFADAQVAFERLGTFLDSARHALGDEMPESAAVTRGEDDVEATGYIARFIEAMDDDFNSSQALAVLHDLVRAGNKTLEGAQRDETDAREELKQHVADFLEITGVLALRFEAPAASSELVDGLVSYLLDLREQARQEKAFERADGIRDRLIELGVAVEDTPAGPRWRVGGASS
ncbi:MAG: cysteinyl-tRNA synthetase [Actinomycetota bacterium]|nr:cysteinyl-tRNA synthetase [Actinomycetota bacterium]